jgi:hypothetical protein
MLYTKMPTPALSSMPDTITNSILCTGLTKHRQPSEKLRLNLVLTVFVGDHWGVGIHRTARRSAGSSLLPFPGPDTFVRILQTWSVDVSIFRSREQQKRNQNQLCYKILSYINPSSLIWSCLQELCSIVNLKCRKILQKSLPLKPYVYVSVCVFLIVAKGYCFWIL